MCCTNNLSRSSSLTSISWSELSSLAQTPLNTKASANGGEAMLHMSSAGDVFVSRSIVDDGKVTIHFAGRIAAIQVDGSITASYDSEKKMLEIVAELSQPVKLGPFSWSIPLGHSTLSVVRANAFVGGNVPSCILGCAKPLVDVATNCVPKLPDGAAFLECLKDELIKHVGDILPCLIGCAFQA